MTIICDENDGSRAYLKIGENSWNFVKIATTLSPRGEEDEGDRAGLRVRGGERERNMPLQLRGSAEGEIRPGLDERARGVRAPGPRGADPPKRRAAAPKPARARRKRAERPSRA